MDLYCHTLPKLWLWHVLQCQMNFLVSDGYPRWNRKCIRVSWQSWRSSSLPQCSLLVRGHMRQPSLLPPSIKPFPTTRDLDNTGPASITIFIIWAHGFDSQLGLEKPDFDFEFLYSCFYICRHGPNFNICKFREDIKNIVSSYFNLAKKLQGYCKYQLESLQKILSIRRAAYGRASTAAAAFPCHPRLWTYSRMDMS